MKLRLSIFALFLSVAVSAQAPEGIINLEDAGFDNYFHNSKIPVVTGKISNLDPADLSKIKIAYSIVRPLYNFQDKKVARVQSDGTFELKLDNPFPYQQIWFRIGDTVYTCLYANSDLHIELDAAKIDKKEGVYISGKGLTFSGTDGELNQLMNDHILFKRDQQMALDEEIDKLRTGASLQYDEYLKKYNEISDKIRAIDKEFIESNPSKYSFLIENERLSDYYANLFLRFFYEKMPDDLWEKVKSHKSYSISNDGRSFYNNMLLYISAHESKVQFSNLGVFAGYSKLDDHGKMILDSLSYYQKTGNPKSINKMAPMAIALISDTIAIVRASKTIEYIDKNFAPSKADYLKIQLGSRDQDEQIAIDELILQNITTGWCKEVMNTEYQNITANSLKVKTLLQESKPLNSKVNIGQSITELSFGAKLYTFNKGTATELLTSLKNEFKGKAILIDFWATWCGPCLSEMPYSRDLQGKSKDLPIEFVYLCTSNDSSQDKWKSKIAELKIPGTHIFVNESIENDLMRLFSAQGYPSYILIDLKGNVKKGFQRPSGTDVTSLKRLISQK